MKISTTSQFKTSNKGTLLSNILCKGFQSENELAMRHNIVSVFTLQYANIPKSYILTVLEMSIQQTLSILSGVI